MNVHTLLIVDDQVINRKMLAKLLQADYQILEAENGREALRILRENSSVVSAVLLDIVMPVMDGYDVLKAMRSDPLLSKIPVIVSSQKDGDEAELQALSLGAQDFVSKPYKADIIRHRLENTIRLRETAAIANQAEKDELTGLMSKRFFQQRVAAALRENPDTAYDILCFDIARFKLVNDTYGEKIGDKLLCYIASLLREAPDAVCSSRFTSDHFYQLYPRPTHDAAEGIQEFFAKVHEFPIDMQINVNCGVYRIEEREGAVSAMCDRAKIAADTNRAFSDTAFTVYDDSIRKQLLNEQFIIGSMKAGLEKHQFQIYYQPKYDLHTEMIAGAEALVRWNHPERGFLSPGEFIPIFEKNGFITQLDRYVWEETCKTLRRWMDAGLPPVPVSVNVSRADIFNPNLPEIILGLTQKYQLPIPYLHLEITESAYTDNPEQIISVVGQLHDLGFVIEMDDFGSGYSSLNMLAELPVDVLKLDMGFVQVETNHTSGRGIMSFVISLAKWMKLSVVAEGVETAEQIETLRSMDCSFVQGYYFAKPMPRAEFETLLQKVAVAEMAQAKASAEHDMSARADAAAKEAVAAQKGHVMLIVDDIEVNRAVLRSIFERDYSIVEKENGRRAFEYLQQNAEQVDIILLDLLMPVMDGFQFLELLKSSDALQHIPVVVTSQGDVVAEEKALERGADDFISKPYSAQIVAHRVYNVIQGYKRRNEKQQELNETKKREQTLMSSIPGGVAIYHLKKDGRVATEYVSDGLAKLCGYTEKEFLDYLREDARINVMPEDVPRLSNAVRTCMETHKLLHEVQHLYTKNKEIIPVRLDASLMTDDPMAQGDVAIMYAVHTRISDDMENVLQEQNRYRYILDNLDLAYFEMDAGGTPYASDKYSLYALSEEKNLGGMDNGGCYDYIYPEDLPLMFEFFGMKKRGLPKVSTTLRLKMKDGTYRWTEVMGFFEYDERGRAAKTIVILRDVDTKWENQNRKLQEALDSAEKANHIKAEFLARASHEMRTPLNGILGIAELMGEKKAGEEIRDDIEKLKESGHYLLELVNDTIDVNTIEKGRMQLYPTVCDGKSTFQNVISMVKPGMEEKHIEFVLQTGELPFTMLYIDVGRVEQAVMNVLSNAVKFTPAGGRITFLMENIDNRDGVITDRIVIRDTGIGISKEFLGRVFEPFAQEHDSSKSQYGGTGLGMTIAKQSIELMGGTISIASTQGEGTEVTIVLPMRVATREQLDLWHDEQAETDLKALRGKRVLLCEDHPLNAQIAIRLLQKKGLQVDHAENGKIGLERFKASRDGYYAAILMDIRMPVMDGLETTRILRSLKRKDARQIPIIAMTANALQEDVKNSLNAGMTEHLGKPVEPARLYRTLAKLITRPTPYAGRKILVVDDLEINRNMVKAAIRDIYTVLEAENGAQALELLAQNEDVVAMVTDIQMPQMDGKELIRCIRADRRYDNMAILANTIYGDHRQEDELIALGANDFVYKPTSPLVVQMRLEHILRNMS